MDNANLSQEATPKPLYDYVRIAAENTCKQESLGRMIYTIIIETGIIDSTCHSLMVVTLLLK